MYPFIVFAVFAFAIAAAWHELAFDAASESRRNNEQFQAQAFANFAVAFHEAIATPFFDHDDDTDTAPRRAFGFSRDFIAHTAGGQVIFDERDFITRTDADYSSATLRALTREGDFSANTFAALTTEEQNQVLNIAAYDGVMQMLFGCNEAGGLILQNPTSATTISNTSDLITPDLCGFSSREAKTNTARARYGYAAINHVIPWRSGGTNRVYFKWGSGGDPVPTFDGGAAARFPAEYQARIVDIYDPGGDRAAVRGRAATEALRKEYADYDAALDNLAEFRRLRRNALLTARAKLNLPEGVYVRAWLGCAFQGGMDAAMAFAAANPTPPPDNVFAGSYGVAQETARLAYRRGVQGLCSATKTGNPLALIVWLENDELVTSNANQNLVHGLNEGAVHAALQKLLPSTTRKRFGIGKITSTDVVRVVGRSGRDPERDGDHRGANPTSGRTVIAGYPHPDPALIGTLPRQEIAGRSDTLTASLPLVYTRRGSRFEGRAESQIAFYSVFPLSDGFDASEVVFKPGTEPQTVSNIRDCPGASTEGVQFALNAANTRDYCPPAGLTGTVGSAAPPSAGDFRQPYDRP